MGHQIQAPPSMSHIAIGSAGLTLYRRQIYTLQIYTPGWSQMFYSL